MSDVVGKFFTLFFAAVIAMIIFVRAGQYGHASGGQQTAEILYAAGGSLGNLGSKLGGGS